MSMSSDAMVERRQLRRRVTFWRVVAGLLAIAAIFVAASRLAGVAAENVAHIARVRVSGIILDDADFTRMLDRLAKSNAKAVLLDIDSPGGGAAASEELFAHFRHVGA